MHPRACVSAISTFNLPLDEDLAFWDRHGITTVGVSVAKLELESGAPAPHAPEVQAADNYFLDDEKIVWHLPDVGSRLIEELR